MVRMAFAGVVALGMLAGTVYGEPVKGEGPAKTLQEQLDERREAFNRQAPEDMKKDFEEGVRIVGASEVMETALKKGDEAPDFELKNAADETVRLSELLKEGPVILTWYRGGWCPYCNIQLAAYQDALGEFEKLGATLVALSPEKPDHSLSTKEKNELEFEVLSDTGNRVAGKYGIEYQLPSLLVERFKGRLDLPEHNTTGDWSLPLAATYVVGQDGVIAYAFVDEDYRERAEVAEIIKALRGLKNQ